MTDLSPAAQAVLNAVLQKSNLSPTVPVAAAALRAAANEVCLRWRELEHPSDVLNRIAAELEGASG